MKLLRYNCIFLFLLSVYFFISFLSCGGGKDIRTEAGDGVIVVDAEKYQSIRLKKNCSPVGYLSDVNTKKALLYAVKNKVDTIQIFNTASAGDRSGKARKYDLRFWNCSDLQIAKKEKIDLENTEKARASIVFLDFINSDHNTGNEWLSSTLPEAVDSSMKQSFLYNRNLKPNIKSDIKKQITNSKNYNENLLKSVAETSGADIVIAGSFQTKQESNETKIFFTSSIYYANKMKIIASISKEGKADMTLFKVTGSLADEIVNKIYVHEMTK